MSARTALITGGSKGIGRAAAQALAERGWKVTLVARDERTLEQARRALPGTGHEVVAMDVADQGAWEMVAERTVSLDGLVCAAARLAPVGPLGSYPASDFTRTFDVNVHGTAFAIGACLAGLREARGSIVTFSGGGATKPLPRFDAYAASKAAVVRLTENIAGDLRGCGIRVNCVAPGFVATDIHASTLAAGPQLVGEEYYERTVAELAEGGVPPREAAELVCELLEPHADAPFTGKLVSAQWDAWRDPAFRQRLLDDPDFATLRRIDDAFFAAVSPDV